MVYAFWVIVWGFAAGTFLNGAATSVMFLVVVDADAVRHRLHDGIVFGQDVLLAAGVVVLGRTKRALVLGDVAQLVCLAALEPSVLAAGAVGTVVGVLGAVILGLAQADGREERQRRDDVADVELDDTPHDQHGGVAITKLDAVDLGVAENGAESGEETETKDTNETELLLHANVELEQDGNRQDGDNHIGDDSEDGICGE